VERDGVKFPFDLSFDEGAPKPVRNLPPPPPPFQPVPLPPSEDIDDVRPTTGRRQDQFPSNRVPHYPYSRRLPAESNRGLLILVLGIISVVALPFWGPISLGTGLAAWTMGQTDSRRVQAGLLDPAGQGLITVGKTCGVIGAILGGLWMLMIGLRMSGR
jgi:hypothetical protein